jgi:4-diphosphocytidyl-2-C-methyl-D-erythritol kinase
LNDFETSVFASHPVIREIKESLYGHGAVYAAMSGSGSTVFGLFNQADLHQLPFETLYQGELPGYN